jgi:hypothetical protein
MPHFKQRNTATVEAWQYQPRTGLPVWAARHVHKLGDEDPDCRTCKDWHGNLHTVHPGDWIIRHPDPRVQGVYAPQPDAAFNATFQPVAERKDDDKDYLNLAAQALEAKLPDAHGFILLVVPFGGDADTNRVRYCSSVRRADAITLLKNFLFQAGAGENWMQHIK